MNKIKKLIKMKYFKISVICVFFAILAAVGITTTVIVENEQKHYVTPYDGSINGQKDSMYIVLPYTKSSEKTVEFRSILDEVRDKYNIPYYLIDFDKYQSIMTSSSYWNLQYLPTYFVFTRSVNALQAKLLYSTYGTKTSDELYKEIVNVQTYGVQTSSVGKDKTIDKGVTLTFNSIKKTDSDTSFRLTFTLAVSEEASDFTLDKTKLKIVDFNTAEEDAKQTITFETEDAIFVEAGQSTMFTVTVTGDLKYNHVLIKYVLSDSTFVAFNYNIWDSNLDKQS